MLLKLSKVLKNCSDYFTHSGCSWVRRRGWTWWPRHERSCQIVISNIKEKYQKDLKAKTTFSLTFEFPVADCLHLRALVREEHSDLEKRRDQTCFMDIRIVLNKRRDVYNGY